MSLITKYVIKSNTTKDKSEYILDEWGRVTKMNEWFHPLDGVSIFTSKSVKNIEDFETPVTWNESFDEIQIKIDEFGELDF